MLGEDNPNALQPVLEEETVEKKEGDEKAFEEWLRLEVEVEEVEIQNYTMVENTDLSARGRSQGMLASDDCTPQVFGPGCEKSPQRWSWGDAGHKEMV